MGDWRRGGPADHRRRMAGGGSLTVCSEPSVNFFKPSEFYSPDGPGSGQNMDKAFLTKLEEARGRCGFPWRVTACFRTLARNLAIEGAIDSWHLKGLAADIACQSGVERYAIVKVAIDGGRCRD